MYFLKTGKKQSVTELYTHGMCASMCMHTQDVYTKNSNRSIIEVNKSQHTDPMLCLYIFLYKIILNMNPIGTEQEGDGSHKLLQKGFPLSVSGGSSPRPHAHLLDSQCLPPEEKRLSMPETGERERNCLFKSYTDLE